jgi:predicted nucleic acid-binding protein
MTSPRYVLDTSILVHAVRQDRVWGHIQAKYQLFLVEPTPIICVVTVGELRSLALLRGWGQRKLDQMEFLLDVFKVADINDVRVIDSYAAIDSHYLRQGRSIGKNDLWIAATSAALGGHLLTCDRDFDDLDVRFLARTWIDPA